MTHTELLEIIRNGENSGVEFKRDVIENHKLAKELVAFANLAGGMVLLGVDDDGSICGITRHDLEEWVMNVCRDKIRPALIPFYEVARNLVPGKDVAVVRITRGQNVHSVWHNNSNSYYIRVGSQSREATPEELARLFQQRATRVELSPVSGAKFSDLDLRRLKDYFMRVRQQPKLVPDDDDFATWNTLLTNTEFMGDEGLHMAAVLLFGRHPQRFLPQATITATAYPGKEKDYAALERTVIKGPLTGLFSTSEASELHLILHLIETGLIEQALAFVTRNAGTASTITAEGIREDRPTYPPEVIREVVVNAVIHRDYSLWATDIELSIYADRLEIITPGRLPNGITPERMRTGCRASRNQLIRDTMSDYKYMDNSGLGIPRKVIPLMRQHNGTEPDLIEDGERFIVVLWRA
jgi:ATP-dependent DNA helicase RecG